MAWHRSGDKPLSEPLMVSLPTHICVTQPKWVKLSYHFHHILLNKTRSAPICMQSHHLGLEIWVQFICLYKEITLLLNTENICWPQVNSSLPNGQIYDRELDFTITSFAYSTSGHYINLQIFLSSICFILPQALNTWCPLKKVKKLKYTLKIWYCTHQNRYWIDKSIKSEFIIL